MMDDIRNDERFAHAWTDARFKKMPKKREKVIISQRFKGMFEDKDFLRKCTVDKRGAPVRLHSSGHLKKIYELDDTEDKDTVSDGQSVSNVDKSEDLPYSNVSGDKKAKQNASKIKFKQAMREKKMKKMEKMKRSTVSQTAESNSEGSDSSADDLYNFDPGVDLARGRILMESSSESSDSELEGESDENSMEEMEFDHCWGELDKSATEAIEITRRLAVINMDWDKIRAVDIFFSLNSFKPEDGVIQSIKIYPSEFGLKRLAEEKFGPPELRRDTLQRLSVLKAREFSRHVAREKKLESETVTKEREKKLNKLARKVADQIMQEDVERGVLEQDTEQRVHEKMHQLIMEDIVLSDEEKQLLNTHLDTSLDNLDITKTSVIKTANKTDSQKSHWDDAAKEDEKMKKYHLERLRQYQLQRLRYFYAVVECDSPETADHIYTECDGKEFEKSSIKMDLQFIQDDMEFDHDPKDECTEIPSTYKPNFFYNTALSQVKVESTWDETDRERTQVLTKKLTRRVEVNEDDLDQYIAPNSDEDENSSDNDDLPKKKEEKMEKEITWNADLKKATENLVKKAADAKTKTVWEMHVEKQKEKKRNKKLEKKQKEKEQTFSDDELPTNVDMNDPYFQDEIRMRDVHRKKRKGKRKHDDDMQDDTEEQKQEKAALELLMLEDEEEKRHFSLHELEEAAEAEKKKKRGKKLKKPLTEKDDFTVELNDPRFQALFVDPLYNVDPASSEYKKTKGSDAIIQEKLRRRGLEKQAAEDNSKRLRH